MVRLLMLFSLVLPVALRAQAHAGCPAHPVSVAAMRGCYRPLVVLAPSPSDLRVQQQQALLDTAASDLMDRNVLYLPVFAARDAFTAPRAAPYAVLPLAEQANLRARLQTAPGAFEVVLLGEDGGIKLRRRVPVSIDELKSLIDTMPTRQREMVKPRSN